MAHHNQGWTTTDDLTQGRRPNASQRNKAERTRSSHSHLRSMHACPTVQQPAPPPFRSRICYYLALEGIIGKLH